MNDEINVAPTEEFLKHEYWRKLYEDAPEGAKRYYRVAFGDSALAMTGGDLGGNDVAREKCFREMDDESWEYVLHHTGSIAASVGLAQARKRWQGKPWDVGGHIGEGEGRNN